MKVIHNYVNKKFYHPSPVDVTRICGRLNLSEERRRLPVEAVDGAIRSILESFRVFRAEGKLSPNQGIFDTSCLNFLSAKKRSSV